MHTIEKDLIVIGAGVVGLACAWEGVRRGLSVAVIDRSPVRAVGASVRSYGIIWSLGDADETRRNRAEYSRQRWRELAQVTGCWLEECGSLHLAHQSDELHVLEEFHAAHRDALPGLTLLTPDQCVEKSPWLVRENLLAGLYSPGELCIDPRQAIDALANYLRDAHGVEFLRGDPAVTVEPSLIRTASGQELKGERVCVCTGADLRELLPDLYKAAKLDLCRLHMLRTIAQPKGSKFGPILAGGASLCRNDAFRDCSGTAAVRARFAQDRPEFERYGIHVMLAPTASGEITIGSSHEYAESISPFDSRVVEDLMLFYVGSFVSLPETRIGQAWHGVYSVDRARTSEFVAQPERNVHVITAFGGSGLTQAFGRVHDLFESWNS